MGAFFKEKHRCPSCKEPLVSEEDFPEGLSWKSAWDGIYQGFFLFRRTRWVCMNKKCKYYYNKEALTHTRFVQSLLPGVMVQEHLINEALGTKKSKSSAWARMKGAILQAREMAETEGEGLNAEGGEDEEQKDGQEGQEQEGQEGAGGEQGQEGEGADSGRYSQLPMLPHANADGGFDDDGDGSGKGGDDQSGGGDDAGQGGQDGSGEQGDGGQNDGADQDDAGEDEAGGDEDAADEDGEDDGDDGDAGDDEDEGGDDDDGDTGRFYQNPLPTQRKPSARTSRSAKVRRAK